MARFRSPIPVGSGGGVTIRESCLRETWTDVDGMRVFARSGGSGEGEPVVLVHGYGVASGYLLPTAEELAATRRVFVPDLPGWGKSDQPDRALDLAGLADALAEFMRAVGVERAVLLGNSFGCQVIVEFALRHPAMISAAVLVGPTVVPRKRSLGRLVWALARDLVREHPAELLVAGRDYLRFGIRNAISTYRFMVDDRIERRVGQVRVPVLVVRGEADPIASQEWIERVAALAPDGELAMIEDGAHAVNFDEPGALAAHVHRFLGARGL